MNETQNNTIQNKILNNKSSIDQQNQADRIDEANRIDEEHFNTRPRLHKQALRAWLYKNDGSIPNIKNNTTK